MIKNQNELPFCRVHKTQKLNWVCLEKVCDSRILCSHCIIYTHKELHKNFNEIIGLINDPLSHLMPSKILNDAKENLSFEENLLNFVQNEEDKLNEIFNKTLANINTKFNELRTDFHNSMIKFVKENAKNYDILNNSKKEYQDFCKNFFMENSFITQEILKEGLDLIINKFSTDETSVTAFNGAVKGLPEIIEKTPDILINGNSLSILNYSNFATKKLINSINKELVIQPEIDHSFWTFSLNNVNDLFELTNENFTLKSIVCDHPVTLLGSKTFKEGLNTWSVSLDSREAAWIGFGIIETSYTEDEFYNKNLLDKALCVTSNKLAYHLVKVKGDISAGIEPGDILEFFLDFDNDIFSIKNAELFEYKTGGVKGKEFKAFFGFSDNNTSQLSLFF